MTKILYPVGTAVQIRDWKVDSLRSEGRTYDRRKRVVSEYVKGSNTPYKLEGVNYSFSVKELKSYRKVSSTVKNDRVTSEQAVTPVAQNSLSASDVRGIIKEELALAEQEHQAAETLNQMYEQAEAELAEYLSSLEKATKKEDTKMSESLNETIRQKIRYATKSKQERVLSEEGVLQNGALTEQGRRVVIDFIWEGDKDLQKAVYDAVVKATGRNKKSKKADDDEE